jgi:DNA processing protein
MLPLVRPRLDERQLIDWLRLLRTEGVGPRTFQSLINHYGGAGDAIRALPELSRVRGRAVQIPSVAEVEKELEAARRLGARFIATGEAEYPRALAASEGAPPLIAVVGALDIASLPLAAIVGSRNASMAGLKMTERLAREIGGAGYGIVSGLARGIDARAHEASLPTGSIAVLAGGLDRLYPEENRPLFEELCARGAVVSEMPFGWVARGRDFPRRNRIVSGLALGTIVIEAARKSGSLITARFALEQGREVFAVPGSPLDQRAEGPNDLIRQGATLVRSASDVLDVLRPLVGQTFPASDMQDSPRDRMEPMWDEADWLLGGLSAPDVPVEPPFDGWQEPEARPAGAADPRGAVLGLLTAAPSDPDDLARAAGLTIRELNLILFDLEGEARIERHPGGRVSARP